MADNSRDVLPGNVHHLPGMADISDVWETDKNSDGFVFI